MFIKKGLKFHRLTAIKFIRSPKRIKHPKKDFFYANSIWLFRCDCGIKKEMIVSNVTKNKSKSCGCLKIENRSKLRGEKNPQWKGDKVGYPGIHAWIRKYLPRPPLCQDCELNPPHDAANISQKYKRDFSDWEYLCRYCHMKKDGRLKDFPNKGIVITFNELTLNITQWALKLNMKPITLYSRLKKYNWSLERALTEPVKTY